MSKAPIISHDHAARIIDDALRLRVGRGKRYSVAALADATGIAPRTIESYMQGATPGLNALLSLMSVLGPSFTSDILAPAGMTAQSADPCEPEDRKLLSGLCQFNASLALALEDGFVDHRERAALRGLAQESLGLLQAAAASPETFVPVRGVVK
ncbi:hypothetical protein JI664_12795 [Rhodobacter sp. NTK016B]|uniref:hypothetical protein n=1 Tax=Rhodobacter sp. NTK016B TaxID=2759676 RepID=UPI001A8FE4F1|nr:hypothetical protein [Rhodobacter sp. NTK016B]MBN8292845.1 hypothetical protein [Rhodobacter sp. NTK016B]